MTILKTDLSLFNNIVGWEFKENFLTVTSEFGEINIHYVDENQDSDEITKKIKFLHEMIPETINMQFMFGGYSINDKKPK